MNLPMLLKYLTLLSAISTTALAGLEWQDISIYVDAAPFDKKAVAVYHFTNAGKTPVKISELEVACDCVNAEVAKKEFGPGESGEIKVTFAIEGRDGLHQKTIQVLSDDATTPSTALGLTVNIQEPVRLTPAVLWWKIGDEKKTQKIHLTVSEIRPTNFTAVDCSDPNWRVELKVVTPGRDYFIEATPRDTSKANSALIILTTHPERDAPSFTARIRVQ